MTSILFHTALVPFRDSYTQHGTVGVTFLRIARKVRALGGEAFLLANNELADKLVAEDPAAALFLIRCTEAEEDRLRALYRPWDAAGIADWVALARGEGEGAALVAAILQRVHAIFGFEAVLSWGDDGGVKAFCDGRGLRRLHLELGPTRAPFPETVYFDSKGTNALARFRDARWPAGDDGVLAPWLAGWFKDHNDTKTPGLVDAGLTWRSIPPALREAWDRPLCFLPLQLADDLNLHLGSGLRSPAEFLQTAIPLVRAAGYLPVVKPHPMAHSRPFNLIAQAEALAALDRLGGECILLRPEDAGAGTWLLANAALVVTINSSVGFEAALFGTPVALAGEAAYDLRSLPRLGEADLAALAGTRDGAALRRVVSRMLGGILYPSRLLPSWRFARALLASLEGGERPADEALRRRLGPAAGYNADPSAFLDEAGQEASAPETLDWFQGERVAIRGGRVHVGTVTLPLQAGALVGRALARPVEPLLPPAPDGTGHPPVALPPGDGPGPQSWSIRGYVYRNRERTAASGLLCVARGRVIAAHPTALPRLDLERKRLPSHCVGFEFGVELPAGMAIDELQLLPFDLAQGASLWTLENGATLVAGT